MVDKGNICLRIIIFWAVLVLFFSCSDESGNKSATSANEKDNVGDATLSFNTYNGLVAEEPCNEKLHGVSAHVNENNADYICVFDDAKGIWNWRALSKSIGESEQKEVQSSSAISSSSLQISSSSFYIPSYCYSSIAISAKSSSSSKIETVSSSSVRANWAYLNPKISYGEMEIHLEKYKTVTIGSQTWMAENMFNLGSECRRYESKKLNIKGCLYGWDDAMKICPKGWHLPDSVEFAELLKNVQDAQQLASQVWKKESETLKNTFDFKGTDNYGFSALPIGYSKEKKDFAESDLGGDGLNAFFWTSKKAYRSYTENLRVVFTIYSGWTLFQSLSKTCGLAVRCIKDED